MDEDNKLETINALMEQISKREIIKLMKEKEEKERKERQEKSEEIYGEAI